MADMGGNATHGVLRTLADFLRGGLDPDERQPNSAAVDDRPEVPAHIHQETPGEAARGDVISRTPVWARALIGIQQTMLDVLERQYGMPQDDPIAQHFSAVGTTEQTLGAIIAPSILRALHIGTSGGTGSVTVVLHHASFPAGVKTIFVAPIANNADGVDFPGILVRIPRGAYLGIQQAGTITDLYINAIVTRDRAGATGWFRGLR